MTNLLSAQTIERVIRDYLPQVVHFSLGTCANNRPWVCEVHFAYDEALNLYFRSLTSRRHSQEIAGNANVAGTIIRPHAPDEYPLGIYFEGTARQLEPGDEQAAAYKRLSQRLHLNPEVLEEAKRPDGHQFYKITVDNWYVFGNLDDQGGRKHHLPWNESKHRSTSTTTLAIDGGLDTPII